MIKMTISHIIDRIFIGDIQDAERAPKGRVTLRAAHWDGQGYQSDYIYPISETADAMQPLLMRECAEKLNELAEGGSIILLHCIAGAARSPSVMIVYLVIYKKMSYEDAVAFVGVKRPPAYQINPVCLDAARKAISLPYPKK